MELNELIKKEKINALFDFDIQNKERIKISSKKVEDYILNITNCSEERVISSFKMVHLDTNILKQSLDTLSLGELKKLELALNLIENKEQIVLFRFDACFMEKELDYFKKLFKKLVSKYHKTIVLIDSNLTFLLGLVDRIVVCTDKQQIKVFSKDDLFSDELARYLKVPAIISFNKYVNKNKKFIGKYTDIKELIKAIYREV